MSPILQPPILIAVCGATGTGKSSFVNDVSGADMPVGHSQMSCTSDVQLAGPFELDGREIWLIDTPGFDDSTMSDSQILERIGTFLRVTYDQGQLLSGIIYMHRITDNRMGGISLRNFRVFRELCGTKSLSNVIITTNMWHDPPEQVEVDRERELIENKLFFQPALAKGARMARYIRNQGVESAHDIIRMCIPNIPQPTQFQEEINSGASIGSTSAGRTLKEELQKLVDAQQVEITALKRELRQALEKRDEEARQELEEERKKSEERFAALIREIGELNIEIKEEREERRKDRKKFQDEQNELRQQIAELLGEIADLQGRLDKETDAGKRVKLREGIHARRERIKDKERGILDMIRDFFAKFVPLWPKE